MKKAVIIMIMAIYAGGIATPQAVKAGERKGAMTRVAGKDEE